MKHAGHLLIVAVLLVLPGCDTFFAIGAIVTDLETGEPVPGAKATLVLDKGAGEPNVVKFTGSNGGFGLTMNEHTSAWATLTVEKSGYQTWSTQFRGAPRGNLVIRLIPEANEKTEEAVTVTPQ